MTRLADAEKREEWQKRLKRFEASGLTIAQFCLDENVAPHRFYYWSKRLRRQPDRQQRSTSTRTRRGKPQDRTVRSKCSRAALTASDGRASSTPGDPSCGESMVHFTWDSKLRVSIPAHCLDAIRCVLQCASHANDGSKDVASPASAFRQVIVG
jgi:hypothetical protein